MELTEIQKRLEMELGTGTRAHVVGMNGTTDHVQAIVVSPRFEGLSMVECHRLVMGLFQKEMASNELHAFTFKTFTPDEWEKQNTRIGISR